MLLIIFLALHKHITLMPIRTSLIPNVIFARSPSPRSCTLQNLAQFSAPESSHPPTPPVNQSSLPKTPSYIEQHNGALNFDKMQTEILPVDPVTLGRINISAMKDDLIEKWNIEYEEGRNYANLQRAAEELGNTDIPVAFPTETVYGLAADATRSTAVRAIFAAKGRPSDNPLIVHVHSLSQLRALLSGNQGGNGVKNTEDPIPEIYKPLIQRFWPGPLTLIMPNHKDSVLAPEVTAGLSTFGARMPRSILALALIRLSGIPLAAPSANASTRPSPTAAEHVKDDLEGRIRTIIDGGPCEVGVESTVVDGLSYPPTILRPGGVTVEQLRQCAGWEKVVVGYKDKAADDGSLPKAPGMKYRHYSPKATVILYEAGAEAPSVEEIIFGHQKVGVIRTQKWKTALGLHVKRGDEKLEKQATQTSSALPSQNPSRPHETSGTRLTNLLLSVCQHQVPHAQHFCTTGPRPLDIWDIDLGADTERVARGLFSALRNLDKKDVDVIFVEGIDDRNGDDIAAAIMNRLRKASEIRV